VLMVSPGVPVTMQILARGICKHIFLK
jgi:hypothetical protein